MEALIKAFEQTSIIADANAKAAKRDELVDEMYKFMRDSAGSVYHILPVQTKDLGKMAAFMVTLLAKLNGINCYDGPVLSKECLDTLLALTQLRASRYIRKMARKLVMFYIQANVFSDNGELKEEVIKHLIAYQYDGEEGLSWVYDGLIALCPLSEDAFLGSMVGQCVGDALGFVVEGHNEEICTTFVNEFVNTQTIPTWVRINGITFGQYSDDSQLARETYISVIQANGKLDPAVYGLRVACMFQPGHYRIVGYGAATARAGEALFMGKHYSTTGSKTTNGNGSAMRSGPLGLILSQKSIKDTAQVASVFSSVTHASEACMDGSIAIALGTRAAMATRGVQFNAETFLSHIASYVNNDEYKKQVLNISRLIQLNDNAAAKNHIVAFGGSKGEQHWEGIVSPGVRQSSLWALYSFCKYPNDYVKCIGCAISCGGDVDTTAAMAGSMVGARIGYDKIPSVWKNVVHDLDNWNLQDICELVQTVFNMVKSNKISIAI